MHYLKLFEIKKTLIKYNCKISDAIKSLNNSRLKIVLVLTKKKNSNGYSLNGAVYVAQIDFFKRKKIFLTRDTIIYLMPKSRSLDIDTESDFLKAQKNLNSK